MEQPSKMSDDPESLARQAGVVDTSETLVLVLELRAGMP
jgi:hypothetical protein